MDDPAPGGHPLHVTGGNRTLVAHAVAVLDCPGQHIRNRFNSTVWVPWEPCQIVFRDVITEIIEQKKGIEVLGVSKTKGPPKVHAGTFEGRF